MHIKNLFSLVLVLSLTILALIFSFNNVSAAGWSVVDCIGICLPGVQNPQFVAFDNFGSIFITDPGLNRVLKFDSNMVLITSWGGSGSGNGQFNFPEGIVVDTFGYVYVVDSSNDRVQKFTNSGTYVTSWGSYGSGNGQFHNGMGIGLDSSNNVYVADSSNNRIQKFSNTGTYIEQWNIGSNPNDIVFDSSGNAYVTDYSQRIQKFSSNGTYLSQLPNVASYPHGVTIDASGNIYVTYTGNDKVAKFSSAGSLITIWGSEGSGLGQIDGPVDVSVDPATGNLFVLEANNSRFSTFDSSGAYIRSYAAWGSGNGEFSSPYDVEKDSLGNIYVVDMSNTRIQKFDSNGNFVTAWGSSGSANGQFSSPKGIAIDSSNNIYIADCLNHRVQKFDTSGGYLTKWSTGGCPSDVAIDGSGNVYVTSQWNNNVEKYTSAGTFISTFGTGLNMPQGLDIDSSGNIFVANFFGHGFHKYNSSGTLVGSIDASGTGPGQFDNPRSIFVDADDNVYVSDPSSGRVEKFTNNLVFMEQFGTYGDRDMQFKYVAGIFQDSDGAMFVVDSGNSRVLELSDGYSIAVQSPLAVLRRDNYKVIGGNNSVNSVGENLPALLVQGDLAVTTFSVDLTTDRNWTTVSAVSDGLSSRTVIQNLNPVDAPGVSSTHTLYVPKISGQDGVYVCPNANEITDVYLGCPGGYRIGLASANLSSTSRFGQDYWVISGLTGTGALGLSQIGTPFTLTPNSDVMSGSQEVVMSYGITSGFASGDKVQFHFEPTAGFVLANTCATPTTDSNNDTVVDGSATIVGSDVYEYTFSSTVGGPTTLSFCAVVTSPATAGSYSVSLTDDSGRFGSSMYYVGGDNEVFVIANVAPSLSFNIRTLADDADTNVCSFGTVSPSDTLPNYDNVDDGASECGYALAVGTNAANGFQVQITADDQLNGTSGNIADLSNGGTFSAGVEAYGLANVTSSTSGRNVTTGGYTESILRNGNFALGASTGTNIPLSATNFVSYTNGIQYVAGVDSLDTTSVVHGLVIGSGTPAGYYDQVVTYTTTANF